MHGWVCDSYISGTAQPILMKFGMWGIMFVALKLRCPNKIRNWKWKLDIFFMRIFPENYLNF